MGGYSEAIRAELPVKFNFFLGWGGILKLSELNSLSNLTFLGGGILKLSELTPCQI